VSPTVEEPGQQDWKGIVTASYIFSPEGLASLARYVAPDTLIAFDLDGTLAPIVEEYWLPRVLLRLPSLSVALRGLC
jgi:trehalose 6-phosphate phosphatase